MVIFQVQGLIKNVKLIRLVQKVIGGKKMKINPSIANNYHTINLKNNTIVDRQNIQNKNHLSNNTFSTQDLFYNQNTSKEEALGRAMEPIFVNVTKADDGTITFDRKQLSQEEVLSLKESDLKNVGVNWGSLELQLAGQQASFQSADQIAYNLDYFASEYAAYASQINMRFDGEEWQEQLQKLDDMMYTSVEKYANEFAEMASSFFSENGIDIDGSQFKETILGFFEQRKDNYTSFIRENENYAGIKGTEDEWLLSDVQYMSEQLRYSFTGQQTDVNFTSANGMNIDDLVAVGTIMKETKHIGSGFGGLYYNNHKSEEEFGVELGIAAMKYGLITDNYDLTDGIKANLDTAFGNFLEEQNERASNYVKEMQQDPFVRDKEAYAVDWNKEQVSNIINKMVENLKATDMNESFKKDIHLLLELYKTKASSGQTSELSRYHDYHNSWEESDYVADWNRFVDGLSLQTGSDLSNYALNNQIDLFRAMI